MSKQDNTRKFFDWNPVASPETIVARSRLLYSIRSFFHDRDVLEVETPVLGQSTATDPHLRSFELESDGGRWFLQTSPEFHMKRLLAAEKKSIYQICKSFRQGELGTNHNPEFTMLEWYRVGYDHYGLMDEVEDLVAGVLGLERFTRISYRTLFEKTFHVNPHQLSIDELVQLTTSTVSIDQTQLSFSSDALTRSFCLDLLMSEKIEPVLLDPVFIYDYPACQAALSTLNLTGQGDQVAQRFELYIQGKELANGYFELRNANVLRERFTEDNNYRAIEGLPTIPPDQYLLAAMEHGLPDCSGVALGVDRLLMLLMGLTSIDASMTFPATVA